MTSLQSPSKSDRSALGPKEWFVVDLAREVGIPKDTLHAWRQQGWVSFRRPPRLRIPCVCWADPEELDRLRRLAQAPKGWWEPAPPAHLTTPKRPPAPYRRT